MENYADFVARKKKSGADIVRRMTPEMADALHMAVGVSSDAGELLDAVKRWAIYGKPLDRANVVEELGDVLFFVTGLRLSLGISEEEVLDANRAKLDKRYKAGYTDAEAIARADKETRNG